MSKKRFRIVTIFIVVLFILSACSSGGNSGKDDGTIELRMTWWGSQDRHDRTLKVIELFEKAYPHIKIKPEYAGDGYWDKLGTSIAGGNTPDIIQLGNNYPDYVNRGAVLDLTPYIGEQITLDDFDQNTIDSGKLNGKLYAVNLGSNASAYFYNKTLLEKHDIPLPPESWTWEEFAEYHEKALEKLGDGYYGFADQAGYWAYFTYFVRQNGGKMYDEATGTIDFDEEIVHNWLSMWKDFRDRGLIPDGETSATYTGGVDNSLLVEGKMIGEITWTNQFVGYQNAMEDELGMALLPQQGSNSGLWIQPSQFIAGYSKTEHPEEVALFLNFMVMDPEATAVLGNERGIPGSAAARDALKEKATENELKVYDYFERAQAVAAPMDREMPGIGEWEVQMKNINEQIAFGTAKVEDVTANVVQIAKDVIVKNTK